MSILGPVNGLAFRFWLVLDVEWFHKWYLFIHLSLISQMYTSYPVISSYLILTKLLRFHQPITAIQNSLPATDIAIGSSLATFSGYFGSAMFLSFASTIFTNSLTKELAMYVPNIDTEAIVASGATKLRDLVKGAELEGVLIAYNESLIRCFVSRFFS